jgi:hypothetical protein
MTVPDLPTYNNLPGSYSLYLSSRVRAMTTSAIRRHEEIESINPGVMKDQKWQHDVDS